MKNTYYILSFVLFSTVSFFILSSLNDSYFEKVSLFFSTYDFSNIIISVSVLFVCLVLELYALPFEETSIYKILHPDKSIITDIVIGGAYTLGIFFFIKLFFLIGLDYHFDGFFKVKSKKLVEYLYYIPRLIFFLLFADFLKYIYHRILHQVEFLWQIHKYHHAATSFVILSGKRNHPLEHIMKKLFVGFPLVMMGIKVEIYLGVVIIVYFFDKLQHSMVDWDYGWVGRNIIFSPIGHRIHHSMEEEHWDKNFGDIFVFWDKIFGTYYRGNIVNQKVGVTDNWMNKEGIVYDLWHTCFLAMKSIYESIKTGKWSAIHLRDEYKKDS